MLLPFLIGSKVNDALNDTTNDDYLLTESNAAELGNKDYAGMSWGDFKKQSPFYNALKSWNDSIIKELLVSAGAIIRGAFQSMLTYKNPILALKDDLSTIFKGAGIGITITALLAIAWKLAVIVATIGFFTKGKLFKRLK